MVFLQKISKLHLEKKQWADHPFQGSRVRMSKNHDEAAEVFNEKKNGWEKKQEPNSSWWLNQPIWKICACQIGSWNPKDWGEHFKKWNRNRAIYDIGICVGESTNRGTNLPGLRQKPGCSVSMHGRIRVGYLKIGHPKRKPAFQPSIFRCYVSFYVSFREGRCSASSLKNFKRPLRKKILFEVCWSSNRGVSLSLAISCLSTQNRDLRLQGPQGPQFSLVDLGNVGATAAATRVMLQSSMPATWCRCRDQRSLVTMCASLQCFNESGHVQKTTPRKIFHVP